MQRKNKKLDAAYKMLSEEFELPPKYLRQAQINGKVTEHQVYETLEKYHFEWKHGKWKKSESTPEWILESIQEFDADLIEAIEGSVWIIQPYSRTPIFRDYLTALEYFIETELESREEALETAKAKFEFSEFGEPPEWIYANSSLESAEEFAYILRNSFFINLCSYIEIFLADRYPNQAPRNDVVKTMTKNLIYPIKKERIPGWLHIQKYNQIRNNLVHNDGFLDNSNKQDSLTKFFEQNPPKLETANMSDEIGKESNSHIKILLTSEFCRKAVDIVEQFLFAVDFVANQLENSDKPTKTSYLQQTNKDN
ncbi:hypothetical protein [Candidatus Leptofilum sp.]|uniref:hypothetical protein n=1 Tax=Candidatus Leptofilum sp. TaxID=3241576 RepID=UPI003B5A49C7